MSEVIGWCSKHPGNSMIDCPECEIEKMLNENKTENKAMMTDLEILQKHFPVPEQHVSIERFLAAMKEAREEYGIELAQFANENLYTYNRRYEVWIHYYHMTEPDLTNEQMIDKFNAHLAAQQGERGKG